jgi:hypothetical protein
MQSPPPTTCGTAASVRATATTVSARSRAGTGSPR